MARSLVTRRSNGGQEFGELKAQVAALAETLHDFRVETRDTLTEMKKEITGRLNSHASQIGGLENARTYVRGALWAIGGIGTGVGVIVWGAIKLLTL